VPRTAKYGLGTIVYKIFTDESIDNKRTFSGRVVGHRALGGGTMPNEKL